MVLSWREEKGAPRAWAGGGQGEWLEGSSRAQLRGRT